MEILIANVTGKVRKDKLNGQDYLVVPMSLIVPGVLAGNKGPLYYPKEELAKNPSDWNGMPIVVYHPTNNGEAVSARDPDVLNSRGIGFVFRAKMGDKLTAEAWFNVDDTKRVDNRIINSLEAEEKMELSTGLFNDVIEPAPEGSVTENGVSYEYIARSYRPDHLAILPDQVGACSIKDGCGVLVNKKNVANSYWTYKTENGEVTVHFPPPTENALHEMSHSELFDLLTKLLKTKFTQDDPHAWVSEVFDTYIVYWQGDNLFRLSYTKSGNNVSLGSETPQEVIRETTFVTVTNQEVDMAKKELVTELIANCSCWEEKDREVLNKFEENKLEKLIDGAKKSTVNTLVANSARESFKDTHTFNEKESKFETKKSPTVPNDQVVDNKGEVKPEEKKPQTAKEWLKSAPTGIQSAVQNAMRIEERERSGLTEALVTNVEGEANQKRIRDMLVNKSLEELETMALLSPKAQSQNLSSNSQVPLSNYFGATGGREVTGNEAKKIEPLPLPRINWDSKQVN